MPLLSPQPPKRRVLVVEDDATTAGALCGILLRRGFDVSHATSLRQGIGLLATQPDWVILDLMLPDGPGERLLETIRAAGHSAGVVLTTGVSDPARLRAIDALRPDLILRKPIDLAALLQMLSPSE